MSIARDADKAPGKPYVRELADEASPMLGNDTARYSAPCVNRGVCAAMDPDLDGTLEGFLKQEETNVEQL